MENIISMYQELSEENLTFIPISQLETNPLNNYEIGETLDLENSIQNIGIVTPLSVIKKQDGTGYIILSGARRYTAYQNLIANELVNEEALPCYIIGTSEMSKHSQQLIIETANLETREIKREHHRFHIVQLLFEMVQDGEIREKDIVNNISHYLGKSERYARMYRQIFKKGIDKVQELVKDGEIRIADAAKIASLDKEEQEFITKRIEDGEIASNIIPEYRNEAPKKKSVTLTEEELLALANTPFEDDDFMSSTDLSLDTTGRLGEMLHTPTQQPYSYTNLQKTNQDERYQAKLQGIIQWCNQILETEEPSYLEFEVIEACRLVADKFY